MHTTDEDLCRRCGRCCCAKVIIGDEIVYTPYYCKHFDRETRLCAIYDERERLNPDCLSVEAGIRLGVFPSDCPYVAGLPDYQPPREHLNDDERALVEEVVRRMDNVDPDCAADVPCGTASGSRAAPRGKRRRR